MKKALFIIPYYGELPCYFEAWLISAKAQRNIDFLIITDLINEDSVIDSSNIKVLNWSFKEIVDFIQSKFEFKINLDKPYKLCDFRPAYGYIFSDFTKGYDYWGHCDIDTILGDLFIFLEKYMGGFDVIGRWGHLSLYKNNVIVNSLFMSNNGFYNYTTVFSSEYHYCFDETPGIKMIVSKCKGLRVKFDLNRMVDANAAHTDLIGIHGFDNYIKQIFFYQKGKLYHCFLINNEVKYREILYLHFQSKSPKIHGKIGDSFYVFGDAFIHRNTSSQDRVLLDRMKVYQFSMIRIAEKLINLYVKRIYKLIKMNREQRRINIEKWNIKL